MNGMFSHRRGARGLGATSSGEPCPGVVCEEVMEDVQLYLTDQPCSDCQEITIIEEKEICDIPQQAPQYSLDCSEFMNALERKGIHISAQALQGIGCNVVNGFDFRNASFRGGRGLGNAGTGDSPNSGTPATTQPEQTDTAQSAPWYKKTVFAGVNVWQALLIGGAIVGTAIYAHNR